MPHATPIRVSYVGPTMDLVAEAYRAPHERLSHSVTYHASIDGLTTTAVPPDVVVCNPLARIHPGGIEGACAIHDVVPEHTLVVCLFTRVEHSHAMFVKHALNGSCHPRMLLHYPLPHIGVDEVVEKLDSMARRQGGGSPIQTVAPLPNSLLPFGPEVKDLGSIMAENEGLAKLIYTAATYRSWSTFSDLAREMNQAEGTTKNMKLALKKALTEAGLFPASEIKWTLGQFVRFVVEYQSFILAFGNKHLGFEEPPRTTG